jgi:hypothetical protein
MDLVRASIVQIGYLAQNSSEVNGNSVEWKQLADSAEEDRHTLCKFLEGQSIFTGLFNIYAETCKEMRDSIQPSSKESGTGRCSASRTKQMPKETETLKRSAA